jgi:hypothetical protein
MAQPRGSIKKTKMNPSEMSHPTVGIIFLILLLFPFSSIYATEYYAFRHLGQRFSRISCRTNKNVNEMHRAWSIE